MTFEELNNNLGSNEIAADWSQHNNGKGWKHKSAMVDGSAFLGEQAICWGNVFVNAWVSGNARVSGNAWVSGNARVFGDAQVSGDARVSGNAQVSGDARVSGNAQVFGNAWVFGDAWVFGNAWVFGDAQVFGDARVFGDAWEVSPLFIIGTRYSLTNCKKGHIQIGCKCATFAWWKSDAGLSLAKDNGFTEEQITEYRAYVELFEKVGK